MPGVLERLFHLRERGTTVVAELRGGAVTFATMSYIIFVQPAVLSHAAGMDFGAVMTATCVSAALATLVMGLWANYPIAEAPLMGENFFFAISVVSLMKVPWTVALGIVFLSGALFLGLTLLQVREMILDAVPASLKAAIAAGMRPSRLSPRSRSSRSRSTSPTAWREGSPFMYSSKPGPGVAPTS